LPWLQLFADPPAARAATRPKSTVPSRFGLFFWASGVIPERWVPEATGTGFDFSPQLAPLERHRDRLSVLSNYRVLVPNVTTHIPGPAGLLTGRPLVDRAVGDWQFAGPTADQQLAAAQVGLTPFGSLEVSVDPNGIGMSHRVAGERVVAEPSPFALYERLTGQALPAGPDAALERSKLLLRRSVLDLVSDDLTRLRSRVGSADRIRLEQHTASIRALELRLAALGDESAAPACIPFETRPLTGDERVHPAMRERCGLLGDLLAVALACDLTRVVSVWYSDPLANLLYDGVTMGHHQLTHEEAGEQPMVDAVVQTIMGDLALFLDKLAALPEGDGTVLDSLGLLCTSDCARGRTHSIDDYPILVAGSMGGRLRTGFHHRAAGGANAADVTLTMLRAAGLDLATWGEGEGMATRGVPELEA
jgi:hypothetical protein